MKHLIDKLAGLLTKGQGPRNFMLIEHEMQTTKTLQVTVIWDRWDGVNIGDRSVIITSAYEKANRQHGWHITVAIGLTPQEAIDTDLLPFQIITMCRKSDPVSLTELERAMTNVGDGVFVKKRGGLRFPTFERAHAALQELTNQFDPKYWSIMQEVSRVA